jgi:hypothetical protein
VTSAWRRPRAKRSFQGTRSGPTRLLDTYLARDPKAPFEGALSPGRMLLFESLLQTKLLTRAGWAMQASAAVASKSSMSCGRLLAMP